MAGRGRYVFGAIICHNSCDVFCRGHRVTASVVLTRKFHYKKLLPSAAELCSVSKVPTTSAVPNKVDVHEPHQ